MIRPKPSTPFSVFERSIIAKATSARDALHQLKKAQIARPFGSVRAAWDRADVDPDRRVQCRTDGSG